MVPQKEHKQHDLYVRKETNILPHLKKMLEKASLINAFRANDRFLGRGYGKKDIHTFAPRFKIIFLSRFLLVSSSE
ncbi:hypothetical protein JTE90_009638 [Oedothorax gibbosus]|uniref:Uncharacterized protein n=1 Tax=Oedothorax gibbosus TaxID=931172 RepID=A0AAV6VCM3_9ARAC|nr:hypothetical protein JTE90_009638 [Oedothorax gibbosus]